MKIIRSVATVGGLTAFSRVLGFVRDILIARYLGAGPVADAFFVAFKFPNFFRRLFAEGAFSVAFVPIFSRIYVDQGLRAAVSVAEQIFAILFMTLLILVCVIEVGLPWLMYGIAPGFVTTPERFSMAIDFTRVTFPYILLISSVAFFCGILNSLDRFAAGASAPILLNLSMIFALLSFGLWGGTAGQALTWSITMGGVLQFLWVRHALIRNGVRIRLIWPRRTDSVRQLWRTMIPGAIGAGVMQVNLLVDVIIASLLPTGAISYLYYADRLTQLPLSIVGVAMSTALLPVLSKHLQLKEYDEAREVKNRTLEFSLFLALPASVALMVLACPIISLLFERGAFGHDQALETGYALGAYATGLPAYVVAKVFSASFFAQYDTRTPVKIALFTMVLNVILNLLLMIPLQHMGIAVATSFSAWVNVGLLGYKLRTRGMFVVDQRLKSRFPRIVFATGAMGGILLFLVASSFDVLMQVSLVRSFVLLGIISLGLGGYLISSVLFKAMNVQELFRNMRPSKN